MQNSRSIRSRRPIAEDGQTVDRVAVMLRGETTLSMARRQPVSTSLHLAVSRESGRLDEAQRCAGDATVTSGRRAG